MQRGNRDELFSSVGPFSWPAWEALTAARASEYTRRCLRLRESRRQLIPPPTPTIPSTAFCPCSPLAGSLCNPTWASSPLTEKEGGRSAATMAGDQLQVLNALDVAKTQLYHFTAIVIAGMGFFTDAYDLFCISLVTKLLGRIYYFDPSSDSPGTLPPNVAAAVNGVAFCGTLSGQLFFGWLGDKLGRKKVYGMTLMLMVICSVASGLSFGHTAKGVVATLCFFRFWLGFGIGGDYPLSATIMSEYANKKTRGAFIAAVFAMQGFGILGGGIVALVVSAAFKNHFDAPTYAVDRAGSTVPEADYIWRIILMLGAAPAALTYYWRMKMPETARYTALIAKNAKQAAADMSKVLQVEIVEEQDKVEHLTMKEANSFGLFSREFARRHGVHLVGTTTTWFLLDIAFYSQNLFQKDIFSAIGWIPKPATMNAIEEVFRIARAQTLIALCGTVPGYWFTVAFIDTIGRFTIQLMGFFFMTVFMLGLAIPYHHWTTAGHHIGFVVMYGFTFFFANFGPNSTTFIVPAEIFPARLRSTCHGISAAAGKAGAIVGAFGFLYAAQSRDPTKRDKGYPAGIGVRNALFVLAASNLLGLILTFLVPESKGKSLEEMSGENEEEQPTSSPVPYSRTAPV
ncbi:phosphate transporter [Musa troglodytarum]|uniref:H(+)/Pi cotransporter n=1 Tax=Musa troglodytarum TaxID=320322 RepID=A0A9E7FHT0_9LILI|nr:phosphate transporter [Musa troglodytarum]